MHDDDAVTILLVIRQMKMGGTQKIKRECFNYYILSDIFPFFALGGVASIGQQQQGMDGILFLRGWIFESSNIVRCFDLCIRKRNTMVIDLANGSVDATV